MRDVCQIEWCLNTREASKNSYSYCCDIPVKSYKSLLSPCGTIGRCIEKDIYWIFITNSPISVGYRIVDWHWCCSDSRVICHIGIELTVRSHGHFDIVCSIETNKETSLNTPTTRRSGSDLCKETVLG